MVHTLYPVVCIQIHIQGILFCYILSLTLCKLLYVIKFNYKECVFLPLRCQAFDM